MNMNIKLPSSTKELRKLFMPLVKHHYFIAIFIILTGAAVIFYLLNQTLSHSTDEAYRSELLKKTIGSQFNKSTQDVIEKIDALQRSEDTPTSGPALPGGRINPFAE